MNNKKMQKIWGAFRSLSVTSSTKHDGSLLSSDDGECEKIRRTIKPYSYWYYITDTIRIQIRMSFCCEWERERAIIIWLTGLIGIELWQDVCK